MQITSWNVNGIRAAVQKGALAWAHEIGTDVLCLQEVKARQEQFTCPPEYLTGFHCYWNAAVKPGYSGVAVYSRTEPLEVVAGIGREMFDSEGRVLRLRYPNFLLYNIYFPSGQRGMERVAFKLDFYAYLLEQCRVLLDQGENIIICGDLNTAHQEIDLANPRSNRHTSGFLPEERKWVSTFLEAGFVDVYRALYPERVQYTWWTYTSWARRRNIGWRLDYFLVSQGMWGMVRDMEIHDEVTGSDHCPISLHLA